ATLVAMPADRIHLVRHGEVLNPDHVVYAALPGYGLSDQGTSQAAAAANRLAHAPVTRIVCSPLERARQTAAPIAAGRDVPVVLDDRMTEWALAERWSGERWDDLPSQRPGELEAYLEHPEDLAFTEEPLEMLARRTAAAVTAHAALTDGGDLVVISHQDPIEAARRRLTGRGFDRFHEGKPDHATIVTLEPDDETFVEKGVWTPDQGAPFPPLPS
ncbi:MAG: histidine phosphatase family protein, partial [Acidimicrobiia bacterium]